MMIACKLAREACEAIKFFNYKLIFELCLDLGLAILKQTRMRILPSCDMTLDSHSYVPDTRSDGASLIQIPSTP
jgi:hypothetical protein